jgi:hypothetical protein
MLYYFFCQRNTVLFCYPKFISNRFTVWLVTIRVFSSSRIFRICTDFLPQKTQKHRFFALPSADRYAKCFATDLPAGRLVHSLVCESGKYFKNSCIFKNINPQIKFIILHLTKKKPSKSCMAFVNLKYSLFIFWGKLIKESFNSIIPIV